MTITNKNVERSRIVGIFAGDFFAEESNQVSVTLENASQRASFLLELGFQKQKQRQKIEELFSGQSTEVMLEWRPVRRGPHRLERIVLSSRFPFGLLRAWRSHEQAQTIMVYPARQGQRAFPLSAMDHHAQGSLGLFRDHREYQSTDSPRRIDWRASAKHQELLVKNFEASEKTSLNLSWGSVDFVQNFEDKISQLCLWICLAEDEGRSYSLHLREFHSGTHQGREHRHRCLSELAMLKEGDV